MKHARSIVGCLAAAALTWAWIVAPSAQETTAPVRVTSPQASEAKPQVPVKVTVVISRVQGEKKTASLPFTLWVNANGRPTSLRMTESVAIPQSASGSASYVYRDIGTSIDAGARTLSDDRLALSLTIDDSQIFSDPSKLGGGVAGMPSFQSFRSQNEVILRDGQTAQYTTATDKITGEVVRVDVTVNVLK
jgi:hypothetical protein